MKKGTVCPKTEESNGKILDGDENLTASIIMPDLLSRHPVKALETQGLHAHWMWSGIMVVEQKEDAIILRAPKIKGTKGRSRGKGGSS